MSDTLIVRSGDGDSRQVRTYRHVRFALLALLLALLVSLTIETVRGGWHRSVSGYYYTPAGPVFIAVLAGVGVCMVALQGFTEAENVCLKLAGISAPMVAFVPMPNPRHPPDVDAITNSAVSYLAVLGVGYLLVRVVVWRRRRHGVRVSPWGAIGLGSVALAWLVGVVWLAISRTTFVEHAHVLAAIFTLVPFVAVVLLNTDWGVRTIAREPVPSRTRFDKAYWAVFVGMVCVGVFFGVLHSWTYVVLAVEVAYLLLFAVFWILQTIDLMDPARDTATVK